jgi:membrane protein
VTRRILAWYFATLSMVNVIYGSFATAVIVLLTLEVAAIILLLGAQVIAEVDRARGTVRASGTEGAARARRGHARPR